MASMYMDVPFFFSRGLRGDSRAGQAQGRSCDMWSSPPEGGKGGWEKKEPPGQPVPVTSQRGDGPENHILEGPGHVMCIPDARRET